MNNRAKTGGMWMVTALCVAMVSRASAQGPADMPKVPVLEATTYAVIKLDVTKIDGAALSKWLADGIDKAIPDPAQKQQMLQTIQPQLAVLTQMQQDFIRAGGSVVYFAFNEFPPNNGPLVFAPVAANGNRELIRGMMYSGPNGRGQKGPDIAGVPAGRNVSVTVAMPDGVFMGSSESYLRIKEPHIGAPHLLFAFSQLPAAAPVQAVAASNEILSLTLEAMAPQIPPPVDLPMTTLTHGISTITGTLMAPPGISAKVVIQAQDAATAAQLKAAADKLVAMLGQQAQRNMPGMDPQTLLAALTPKVQDNQVVLEINAADSNKLVLSALLPSMQRARQTASMVASASVMRQIVMEMMRYAQQHQGVLPDALDQLDLRAGGQFTPNPRIGDGKPGWVYVPKPGTKLADMKSNQILIYDNTALLPPGSTTINAGYVDGHIDALPLQLLEQRLAAQGADKPVQPGR